MKSKTDQKKGAQTRTNPTKSSWELASIRYHAYVKEDAEYKERLHPVLNLGSEHWTQEVCETLIRIMINLQHGEDMTRWQAAVHLGDTANANPRKLVNLIKTYDENGHRILNVFNGKRRTEHLEDWTPEMVAFLKGNFIQCSQNHEPNLLRSHQRTKYWRIKR